MPRREPLVTIGMPVYNGARHLRATLDSLLAQTLGDFELIISDNASTDETEAICRSYARADSRIRYHRADVNIGAPGNYRRAFELSSSPYFKWANADDVVASEFLERCLPVLSRDAEVGLAYARTQLIDGDGARISEYDDDLRLTSPSPYRRFRDAMERVGLCNVIYGVVRSDVLRRTRLMGSFMASDRVLVAELALHGRFHEVPEVLFFRRMHADAYSSQTDPARLLEFYNPQDTRRVALFRWRHLQEYARAVGRAPLPLRDRVRLWPYLMRTAVWQRRLLARELSVAAKSFVERLFGAAAGTLRPSSHQ